MTSAWARRRELEDLLRGRNACRNVDRAVQLALDHNDWIIERAPAGVFTARNETRTIRTPPLVTDEDVASFAHEGGHLEDPLWASRRRTQKQSPDGFWVSVPGECFAWLWAVNTMGHRWNRVMQGCMEACLTSYVWANDSYADLQLIDTTIAYGTERAKQVARLRPMPVPAPIAQLVNEVYGA